MCVSAFMCSTPVSYSVEDDETTKFFSDYRNFVVHLKVLPMQCRSHWQVHLLYLDETACLCKFFSIIFAFYNG